jgi:flagellar hook-associated protein 3 FlgL
MLLSLVTTNVAQAASRMSETQKQLSTGKRINIESDDPAGTATALSLRTIIDNNKQFLTNIDSATTWLNATSSALQSGADLLIKVRKLAIQASNSTWSDDERADFVKQTDQYMQEALQIANESLGGASLFGGFQVDGEAFTYTASPTESVTYNGDSGKMIRSINTNTEMIVNINGDTVFNNIFSTLINMKTDLAANDIDGLKLRMTELDDSSDDVAAALGDVGAKTNHLKSIQSRYTELQTNLKSMLSKTEDLDYAEAVSKLSGEETIYKAALEAAAKITKYSLLDYI